MSNGRNVEVKGENAFLAASRIFTGALVVVAALAAAVVSLGLILDNYDVSDTPTPAAQTATNGQVKVAGSTSPSASTTDTASVSASSVVAILTPVIAGIVGIAGLFFSISATGSARGREAEAEKVEAEAEKVKAERELVAEISSTEGKPQTFGR